MSRRATVYWVFWSSAVANHAMDWPSERSARAFADGITTRAGLRLERHEPSSFHAHYDVTVLPLDGETGGDS